MIFSFKELKKIAGLKKETSLKEVIYALNDLGFEVNRHWKTKWFSKLKFGLIKEKKVNPNDSNLLILKIKFKDKIRQIQTNAKNVDIGNVILAVVKGSKIDNEIFDNKKIKGYISEGMLISISALAENKDCVSDKYKSEVLIFEKNVLEKNPIEFLELNDILIDVDILSNRADAASYYIIGRELAAYFFTKNKFIKSYNSNLNTKITSNDSNALDLCFVEAKGKINISIQKRLLLIKNNIKLVNNIVDLSNLTFIMTGQPIHAYDIKKIGREIKSDFSSRTITILGKRKVKLNNNLVIKSNNNIIALAGVIGIDKFKVTEKTKGFVFELAKFNGFEVRRTMQKIKLFTDAGIQSSKSFGRGLINLAYNFLASKLEFFSKLIGYKNERQKEISLDLQVLDKVSGFKISESEKFKTIMKQLQILGFEFDQKKVKIPEYRNDINSEQDIQEEILRFYGYNNITSPQLAESNNHFLKYADVNKTKLVAQGYQEVRTFLLTSNTKNFINFFDFKKTIKLKTFVSKDRIEIRDSLIPSLLEISKYNLKRGLKNFSFFTIGQINKNTRTIALISSKKEFAEVKKDILNLFAKNIYFRKKEQFFLHPGISAELLINSKTIGYLGKLHPKILDANLIIAEFLIPDEKNSKTKIDVSYSNSPIKYRDITFAVKKGETILKHIEKIPCFQKEIIDVFENPDFSKITVRFFGDENQIKFIDENIVKFSK